MNEQRPENLKLYGVDLPFVKTATHLDHQLSEDCKIEYDIRCRRAEFIGNSTEVREMFHFAQPNQIIQAVKTYCCSMHNCMTWRLFSSMADQFFNSWSTCVKLAWRLDRATKSLFVDNFLSGGLPSMRSSVLACFGNYFRKILTSPSLEIRIIGNLAGTDVRSNTGNNLHNLAQITGLDPVKEPAAVRRILLESRCKVLPSDAWRIPCLKKYLDMRFSQEFHGEDTSYMEALILSLTTT